MKLRKDTYANRITCFVELSENFTIKDERAIKKVTSGLIKLLFSNGEGDNEEFKVIIDLASGV